MISGKHGWMTVLPGLLLASAVAAQATSGATRKQLHTLKQKVASQQAKANDLKQKVAAMEQRNKTEQATLADRDQEIARLKAQLGQQAGPAAQGSSATPPKGH